MSAASRRRYSSTLALVGLALLLASPVQAAPPVDTGIDECNVKHQCGKDEEGASCRASRKTSARCHQDFAREGWTYRCKTRGMKVWTEVYCRARRR